jgi:hypothetical protein
VVVVIQLVTNLAQMAEAHHVSLVVLVQLLVVLQVLLVVEVVLVY